jgi:hypothetical protein
VAKARAISRHHHTKPWSWPQWLGSMERDDTQSP